MTSLLCCLLFAWSPSDMENMLLSALPHPCLVSWPPHGPRPVRQKSHRVLLARVGPYPSWPARTGKDHSPHLLAGKKAVWNVSSRFPKISRSRAVKPSTCSRAGVAVTAVQHPKLSSHVAWHGVSQRHGAASSLPRVTNALLLKTASRGFPWANLTTGRVLAFHLLNTRTSL